MNIGSPFRSHRHQRFYSCILMRIAYLHELKFQIPVFFIVTDTIARQHFWAVRSLINRESHEDGNNQNIMNRSPQLHDIPFRESENYRMHA